MQVTLEEFTRNNDSNNSIIGWAKVDLGGKMFVFLTVLKGQRGIFAKFPSVKIGGEFRSALGWLDKSVEIKIMETIMPEIKKKLENAPSAEPSNWF